MKDKKRDEAPLPDDEKSGVDKKLFEYAVIIGLVLVFIVVIVLTIFPQIL